MLRVVSVSIDERGTVTSYNNYKPSDYTKRKFPKVSRQEAALKAEDFIKKVNPGALSQVRLNENNQPVQMEFNYNFNYTRVFNGIPFYNNFITVDVNNETGEIQNYYLNWTEDLEFPPADKVISIEEARKAYKEKLGLRLVYNHTYEDNKVKVYAAYVPKYDSGYCIDALTGEKVELVPGYFGPYPGGMGDGRMGSMNMEKAVSYDYAPALTPDELNAVEKVSRLIKKEDAEARARASKHIGLSGNFKLSSASLSKEWGLPDEFTWHLYFEYPPNGDNNEFKSVSARINALTGEIRGFYISNNNSSAEGKFDEAASKAAVEKFLKEMQPDKYSQTEYDETMKGYPILLADKRPAQYNFRFVRKVNGVYFPGNALTVGYDAVNGKILSYDMSWFDIAYPSVDGAASLESVYEILFREIGLELQYSQKYPIDYYGKFSSEVSNTKPEVKLVYALKRNKPQIFDANTGVILNYNGEPYKEIKPVNYTDIKGSFAEKQIIALAEYGIALEGTAFKPDNNITQKDFLLLLSKTMNYYDPEPYSAAGNNKETEQLYNFMIREGVVKPGEKAPDAVLTRENGIKFIIRALKYDRVADIKGIFLCTFKDKDKINPDLTGYVSIAQGLKIVSGSNGYLNPGDSLTRAQAAVMIYNYMQ